ncbi:MAG TPA: hydrogenase subunit MbhD domain-containing protein [Pseudonocardia sp.]|nr:hydrogenase subunit MbhD domain-containing protein [Pseudonocardia sp.]
MTVLLVVALTLVGVCGTVVALTGRPDRQAPALALFGVLLAVLFVLLGAPDAALSEIGVGSAVTPLLVLLTVRAVARTRDRGADR